MHAQRGPNCGKRATSSQKRYVPRALSCNFFCDSHMVATFGGSRVRTRFHLIVLGSLLLGGCSLMPASGPESWDVKTGQRDPRSLPYALVKVTPEVTTVLGKVVPRLTQFAEERRPQDIRLGVGDIVSVTIFEAHSGGLFIPSEAGVRPGNFVTIPSQAVDVNGNVSIPYAGAIRARGRTPVDVQEAIVAA